MRVDSPSGAKTRVRIAVAEEHRLEDGPEDHLERRPMSHDEEQLADCRCDSGNPSNVRCYHACVPQHNLPDRPNSTHSGIWDLVTTAQVSMDKFSRKRNSYKSYDHNLIPFHLGRCTEDKA